MIAQPLHPFVVHFPIVFVVLLPVAAIVAILAIHRGAAVSRAWLPVGGIAAALALSSWIAVETGEREEEIVERVVPESVIQDHEESAEVFFPLTVAGLLLVSAGFLTGSPGRLVRSVTVIAALGLSVAGYQVGHSGGKLVYEHGAANAYALGGAPELDDLANDSEQRDGRGGGSDEQR